MYRVRAFFPLCCFSRAINDIMCSAYSSTLKAAVARQRLNFFWKIIINWVILNWKIHIQKSRSVYAQTWVKKIHLSSRGGGWCLSKILNPPINEGVIAAVASPVSGQKIGDSYRCHYIANVTGTGCATHTVPVSYTHLTLPTNREV